MSDARTAAQWVASRFPPLLKKRNQTPAGTPVTPKRFGELLKMVELDEINVNVARDVLAILSKSDKMPAIIINERGFRQISDASRLEAILDDVIAAHPAAVEDYRKGKKQLVYIISVRECTTHISADSPPMAPSASFQRLKLIKTYACRPFFINLSKVLLHQFAPSFDSWHFFSVCTSTTFLRKILTDLMSDDLPCVYHQIICHSKIKPVSCRKVCMPRKSKLCCAKWLELCAI